MKNTILYDGECPICVTFASTIKQIDSRSCFNLISIQRYSKDNDSISIETLQEEIHIIKVDGSVIRGEQAYDFIFEKIPAARSIRVALGKSSTNNLMHGINKLKRWTKSRFSLRRFCQRCLR